MQPEVAVFEPESDLPVEACQAREVCSSCAPDDARRTEEPSGLGKNYPREDDRSTLGSSI